MHFLFFSPSIAMNLQKLQNVAKQIYKYYKKYTNNANCCLDVDDDPQATWQTVIILLLYSHNIFSHSIPLSS